MKGLYIHIPFCNSICSYCDFPKMVSGENVKIEYIDHLFAEIDSYKDDLCDIDSVFIGGGTPNSLSLVLLERLFDKISDILKKSKENTIELNPELISKELLELCIKYNINRYSIGVESFKEESIKLLNRHHNLAMIQDKIALMRSLGINNVNIDLIFGIPGTDINDVKYDLDMAFSLNPDHISYYSLILEDKTIFMHMLKNHNLDLLDDDLVADMYDYINEEMKKHGYIHYEVSNYYKGKPSIHNLKYWNLDEYIGVGLGASGDLNGYRYTNHKNMKDYLVSPIDTKEKMTTLDRKKEYLIMGLRLIDGVSVSKYRNIFKSDIFDDFDLKKYLKLEILRQKDDRIYIVENKMFISNVVLEDII